MAEILEAMLHRRSIRRYRGEPVTEAQLRKILQAGLLSPSGRGKRPWEFVVVRERSTLLRLSECREGAAGMLAGADCAVVVLGDREKTDTVVEDCSIAMAYMHLMADSLGVGSCWIQGRLRQAPDGRSTEEYVRELLGIPDRYQLEAILSLGIPAQAAPPRDPRELPYEKIHTERF